LTAQRPYHFVLHLLQCRPLSSHEWGEGLRIPSDVPSEDVIFLSRRLVPHGRVSRIRYVVYVDPTRYARVPDYETRFELARVIGRLNKRLEGECFILMGPGRWGTSNVELGLKVTYADIYNARALIEIAQSHHDDTLEVSYGTHFFQDLVEARIYPMPLYPNASDTVFNHRFFDRAANMLGALLPADAGCARFIKVIDVPAVTGGRYLELVMDSEQDEALAYLKRYPAGGR
jgi:pyruvate,water dikinase